MTDKLKEDTVSADRKERIIFDPEAWRKSDKSGKKTSAITSRQNFDNEKFTRKAKEEQVDEGLQQTLRKYVPGYAKKQIDKKMDAGKFGKDDVAKDANYWRYKKVQDKLKKEEVELDEGTIQPSGDSKVDSAGPTQSDTIAQDKKIKKSNNPQIEFVTGTATPNGSSSTAQGGAQATGRKIAESLVKKAIAKVKGSTYAGLEKEDKPGKLKTAAESPHEKGVNIDTVEGWKDEKKPVKEAYGRRDSYTRDYEHSTAGMGKRQSAAYHADGGANDEGWGHETHRPRSTMDRPHTVHINGKAWKKFSNGHQAHAAVRTLKAKGKDAHAVAHFNEEEETTMSKTYAEFMEQLLEYTPGPGGVTKVKGRSYGADYDAGEGDDDDKPKAAAPAVKRGRGRPAGSKSGANQKVTTGKSYGGIATHSLNLPNSR